tara:strand:- start:381 stop:770 length:390 start_codon:yes stop_codon:yes gene_type:complete
MKRITKKVLREFGLIMGVGLPLFFGWIMPLIFGHNLRFWVLYLSLILMLLAIFLPKSLFYPYKFWIALGNILSNINSRIIFGLVFIFVLIPISYIMRLFRHDPLQKKFHSNSSYREIKKDQKIDFKNIF